MKLVLQCAMCGTHHPVGTLVCSTCWAEGVANLRLMFECQRCGRLGLSPECETCAPEQREDDLALAEEVEPGAELTLALPGGAEPGAGEDFEIVPEDNGDDVEFELDELDPDGELDIDLEDELDKLDGLDPDDSDVADGRAG